MTLGVEYTRAVIYKDDGTQPLLEADVNKIATEKKLEQEYGGPQINQVEFSPDESKVIVIVGHHVRLYDLTDFDTNQH